MEIHLQERCLVFGRAGFHQPAVILRGMSWEESLTAQTTTPACCPVLGSAKEQDTRMEALRGTGC